MLGQQTVLCLGWERGYIGIMMASSQPIYQVSADQFLAMRFRPDEKVELDNGVILMMADGAARHAMVQGNILACLRTRLQGTGWAVFGSGVALQTDALSVRYPDVAAYRNSRSGRERDLACNDPVVVAEVLSAYSARYDLCNKRYDYQALASVDTILFVDPDAERVRVIQRTGLEGWADNWLPQGDDVALPALKLVLPHTEIFARD